MEYLLMIKPALVLGFAIFGAGMYGMYIYADHCDKKNSKKHNSTNSH